MKQTYYLSYGDPIRSIATFLVVVIHTSTSQLFRPAAETSTSLWYFIYSLNIASRWAVPAFFMLSGALLLVPSDQGAGTFYRKRFNKVGTPILFWTTFYLIFRFYFHQLPLNPSLIAELLFTGRAEGHLWFLFSIACLYAITPYMRAWMRKAPLSRQWGLCLLGLAGPAALDLILVSVNKMGWRFPWPTIFTEWVYYFGYFMLGYLVRNIRLRKTAALAAFAVYAVVTVASIAGFRYACLAGYSARGEGAVHVLPESVHHSPSRLYLSGAGDHISGNNKAEHLDAVLVHVIRSVPYAHFSQRHHPPVS